MRGEKSIVIFFFFFFFWLSVFFVLEWKSKSKCKI